MKYIITVFLAFGFLYPSMSQDSITEIRYLTISNWSKKMNSLDYLSKQQKEKMAYTSGNKREYKSYCTLFFDNNQSKFIESEEKAEVSDYNYSWKRESYEINRNFKDGLSKMLLNFLGKNYTINDSLKCQAWKISNDLKEVAGYLCMNATWRDTVFSKTVEVWFALDLPMSSGPEFFCGLPGMILELDMNNGAQTYTADRVSKIPRGSHFEPLKKVKSKVINGAEYNKLVEDYIKAKRMEEEPYFWGIRY